MFNSFPSPSPSSLLLDADRGSHSSLQRSHPHHDKGFPCQRSELVVPDYCIQCITWFPVSISLIASDEELGWGLGMRLVNLT